MSRLISFVLAEASYLPREESENYKILPTAGFEPTSSRLLDWRSNVLRYFGSKFSHLKVNAIHIP